MNIYPFDDILQSFQVTSSGIEINTKDDDDDDGGDADDEEYETRHAK